MSNGLWVMGFLGFVTTVSPAKAEFSVAESAETAELFDLERNKNPFKKEVPVIDPRSGEAVDQVLLGPVYKARRGAGFDYYRYVTFYNVDVRRERINSLATHREECYDDNEIMAQWSYSYSYTAKVSVGVNIQGVGLSADFSRTKTMTTTRNVKGHGKHVIDHTPYMYKQDWTGLTYLQTVNSKTGREDFVLERTGNAVVWMPSVFPMMVRQEYPLPFSIRDADWTLVIERTELKKCPGK